MHSHTELYINADSVYSRDALSTRRPATLSLPDAQSATVTNRRDVITATRRRHAETPPPARPSRDRRRDETRSHVSLWLIYTAQETHTRVQSTTTCVWSPQVRARAVPLALSTLTLASFTTLLTQVDAVGTKSRQLRRTTRGDETDRSRRIDRDGQTETESQARRVT